MPAADDPHSALGSASSTGSAAALAWPARLTVATTVLLIAALIVHQARIAWSLGNELSARADPYSEADAVRSGEGYAALGFAAHHGLPDVLYGGRFPQTGNVTEPELVGHTTYVYTHYPPGPNWIVGVMTKLFGVGRLRSYRLAPLALGALALTFYAWALARRMGAGRGLLLLVLTGLPRMTTQMMHGLHYQGYAQSLLLVQIGLLLLLLPEPGRMRRVGWGALVLVGFAQGWLSFDHAFLVAFTAVPLALATAVPAELPARVRRERLALGVLLPAAGFATAHALHFLQVVLELGGPRAALEDFRTIARFRAVGTGAPLGAWGSLVILREYLTQHVVRGSYFGKWAYLWLAGAGLSVSVRALRWHKGRGANVEQQWRPAVGRGRRALALLAALAVSAGWIMLMRNHAHHHPHFLPRHFFVLYFTGMLLLVEGLGRTPAAELTPVRAAG